MQQVLVVAWYNDAENLAHCLPPLFLVLGSQLQVQEVWPMIQWVG